VHFAGHLFIEGNVDGTQHAGNDRAEPQSKPLDQTQADVTELHRDDLPREGHPDRRAPDHWPAADRIVQRSRDINDPRVGGKLQESDKQPEQDEVPHQTIAAEHRMADQDRVVDQIQSKPRSPIRP
jgi:hypothetical protein